METTLSAVGVILDVLEFLSDRGVRRFLAVVLAIALAIEATIMVTGWWPLVSAPPDGTVCSYWTGARLVDRTTTDVSLCPPHLRRS